LQKTNFNHFLAVIVVSVMWVMEVSAKSSIQEKTYENDPPCIAYKHYLSELPWVKKVIYEKSYSTSFGSGFGYIDGAIQPSGYYIRIPTNSEYGTNFMAFGFSSAEWQYSERFKNVMYSPRLTSWTNFQMNYPEFSDLSTDVRLGILAPDQLKWTSPTEFSFETKSGKYIGKIEYYENDRPLKVSYKNHTGYGAIITYEYETNRVFPPKRYISFNGVNRITNILHVLEVGIDNSVSNGYEMNSIIPTNPVITDINVISNSERYVLQPDKTLKKYIYSDDYKYRSLPMRLTVIGAFILIGVLIFIYIKRSQ